MAVIKGEIDDYETGDTFAKRAQGTAIFLLAGVLSLVALASTTEPAYEVRRLDATQHCPTTCGAYANRTKMRDETRRMRFTGRRLAPWRGKAPPLKFIGGRFASSVHFGDT